jgi:hypothetical protein
MLGDGHGGARVASLDRSLLRPCSRSIMFSGSKVDFYQAQFSGGRVRFSYAEFSGDAVDFSRVSDCFRPTRNPLAGSTRPETPGHGQLVSI